MDHLGHQSPNTRAPGEPAHFAPLEGREGGVELAHLCLLFVRLQESVADGGAGEALEGPVVKAMIARRPHIFVGQVDARDAGIVGGQDDRNTRGKIGGDGMLPAPHAQDHVR